ncbi:unnamed protein product [Blepharisma stoltei]|uniref:Uncharacterized protein n=1 Tax=Blepharisma stoltei TaxID=1481888 RepID=A0AAU9INH0_9CILI|nr:unnamed protein product [Blepharisma stoltei]
MLKLFKTYPKTSIFLILTGISTTAFLMAIWKYRYHIRMLWNARKVLSGSMNVLDTNREKEVFYSKLSRTFTTWTKRTLPEIQQIRLELRTNKNLTSSEKRELWSQLNLKVMTQLLTNIYSSEIYKLSFLISTHLIARKEFENEQVDDLIENFERMNAEIKQANQLIAYIENNIQELLLGMKLEEIFCASDLKELFEKIKLKLHGIVRTKNPVYEIFVAGVADWAVETQNTQEFCKYYYLEETQGDLMRRVNEGYEKLYDTIKEEIGKNGKNNPRRKYPLDWKGLELAFIIPMLDRLNSFTVWEPYETLGRKIYFDL